MKRKTNISVQDDRNIRVTSNMILGSGSYVSGDILDANAVEELINSKITALIDGASGSNDTLKEIETTLGTKQDALVSGTNIKTIDGTSVLGEGDLAEVINQMIASYIASQEQQTEVQPEEQTEEQPPL